MPELRQYLSENCSHQDDLAVPYILRLASPPEDFILSVRGSARYEANPMVEGDDVSSFYSILSVLLSLYL